MQNPLFFTFTGFFVGINFTILALSIVDKNFTDESNVMENIVSICSSANSTPKSFDKTEVTCKNGAVMKINTQ